MILFALLFAYATTGTEAIVYCNLCSDTNIETHFGVFFSNPRDLQEGFKHEITGCNSTDVTKQECETTCFSLNVTSLHIKSRKLIPFGVSYGCSSQVMPEKVTTDDCLRKDIVLRTIPPYVVQAEYCSCRGELCNHVTVLPIHHKKPGQYFYEATSSLPFLSVHFAPLVLPFLLSL